MPRPADPAAAVSEAESLAELAALANAKHHEGTTAAAESVQRFREAGLALMKAKAKVKQGGWLNWLKKNVKFSYETARNYIRVAESWDKVVARYNSVDSLRGFFKLLGMDAKEEETEAPGRPDAPLPDGFASDDPTAANDNEPGDEEPAADPSPPDLGEPAGRSIWTAAEVKARVRECENYIRRVQEWLSYAVRDGYRDRIEKAARLATSTRLERTEDVIKTTRVQGANYGIPRVTCPALDDLLFFLTNLQRELESADDLPAPDRLTRPEEYAEIPMGKGA